MAKSPRKRKTLAQLFKKVEDLENQVFAQKLHIDELDNKLSSAEETIKQMKEDPFGLSKIVSIPSVWPAQPATPTPAPQQQWIPSNPTYPSLHVCQPDILTTGGTGSHCTICGMPMYQPYVVTNTTGDDLLICLDPSSQSSSDVEPIMELDPSWILPDEDSTT